MRTSHLLVALAAALALAGCKKDGGGGGEKTGPTAEHWKQEKAKLGGVGKRLASGAATELRLAPKGKTATYLLDAEKPRLDGIPPQMRLGALWSVAVDGGEPRRLGSGVTNVPGGWLFSADGRWALLLEGFNPASAAGTLVAVDLSNPKAEPQSLGENVTYMLASPDSVSVAFVAGGVLKVGPLPGGPFRDVAGEVSTADFTSDSKQILFRRRLTAAGGLFLVTTAPPEAGKPEAPRKLGDFVGDYRVSPDGTRIAFAQRAETPEYKDLYVASAPEFKPSRLAVQSSSFAFSEDGKFLAWTQGFRSEAELGDLYVGAADGSGARKVGDKVGPFTFAPDSKALAYLEYYDPNARAGPNSYGGAGVLGRVDLPDGKPQRVGNRVPNYAFGSDSTYLAFLSRFLKPVYSVDLMLYTKDATAAVKVKPGAFGYTFGPDNGYLVYRSNCIRDGRACDLFIVAPDEVPPPAEQKPEEAAAQGKEQDKGQGGAGGVVPKVPEEKIIEGLYTFAPSKKGQRLLITYPRWESRNFDVAVYNVKSKQRKTLDTQILIPPLFVDDDGGRVVYLVADGERSGLYVASEVP